MENARVTLAWLTDIMKSYDGTEQRISLRSVPRYSVSYLYTAFDSSIGAYFDVTTHRAQSQKLMLPLWQHCLHMPSAMAAKDNILTLQEPMDLFYFLHAPYVAFWKNVTEWNVYGINRLQIKDGYGQLVLSDVLTEAWPVGTPFFPVTWAYLADESEKTYFAAHIRDIEINYEVLTSYFADLPAAIWQPEQTKYLRTYRDRDLWLYPPAWANDLKESVKRNSTRLDNQSGFFTFDRHTTQPERSREFDYVLLNRQEIRDFIRFLFRCRGRAVPFWYPSWTADFELIGDAATGESVLTVSSSEYSKSYNTGGSKKNIILFMKNGTILPLEVAGYLTGLPGEGGRILLKSQLAMPVRRSEVKMISLLNLWRLDNDAVTLQYETSLTATTSLPLMDVTREV